jgi:serine/threonine protein kinase
MCTEPDDSAEICEDKPYSNKSDVWALGCILFELTTLKRAFDGHSLPALVIKILRGRIPPIPLKYSAPLRGLIQSMLEQSPARRPTMDGILKLPLMHRHLERYADHMMTISYEELSSPAALGAAFLDGRKDLPQKRQLPCCNWGPCRAGGSAVDATVSCTDTVPPPNEPVVNALGCPSARSDLLTASRRNADPDMAMLPPANRGLIAGVYPDCLAT